MFWLNFGTFANLDKFISRFNWKGRICGSKSTQILSISICQVKSMAMVRFRSFSDILYKSWGRGETKRGLQEESKWVYGMERESKEGLHNIDGSQPSSGSGVIIMQRLVSDQTSAPANDIPPPVADHRSRSRSLVTERGDRERAQPREEPDNPKPESRSHQLFLLHSPGMRTRDIMSGDGSNLHNNVQFQQFWFWPVLILHTISIWFQIGSFQSPYKGKFRRLLLFISSPQQFLSPNM